MKNKAFIYYIISFFLVLSDQIAKLSIKGFNLFGINYDGFYYGETKSVIGDFLQWTYIENFGMAFGISFGFGKIFLSIFSLLASFFLIYYIYKIRNHTPFICCFAFTLILSGAFGNSIDRCFYGIFYGTAPLFYGGVVDFIMVDIPDINFWKINYTHFPVFNIADSCVTCGVILLLFVNKHIPPKELVFPNIFKKEQEKIDLQQ